MERDLRVRFEHAGENEQRNWKKLLYENALLPGELKPSLLHPKHQRVEAAAAVSFKQDGIKTRLDRLYQQGSAKIRLPKNHQGPLEAVLINTAGGLTGGDKLCWDMRLGEKTSAVITTQACEKSYKSSTGKAQVQNSIALGEKSSLHFLPQETILYDGSALSRNYTVEMGESAEFLAMESMVLGREAMGEEVRSVFLHDRWRIKKAGKTVFADDFKLQNVETGLSGLGYNRALATLLFISPKDEDELGQIATSLREVCPSVVSGFSAFEGKITGRLVAPDSFQLRNAMISVLKKLRGLELPRVWRT